MSGVAALRRRCEPVSRKEGGRVARQLWAALDTRAWRHGLGLAAIQLGCAKQVCVIRAGNARLSLMNPRVVAHSAVKVSFEEGCLSFPGKTVDAFRWPWVEVDTLNHGTLTFGSRRGEWSAATLLQAVVVQHEIAHCHGLLFSDFAREDYPEPTEWEAWAEGLRNEHPHSHVHQM
jgi:peptide deformylase